MKPRFMSRVFPLYALAAMGMADTPKKKECISNRNAANPHNFPRFETDGFVSYSINQAAHDAKYAKYLKGNKC